MDAHVFRKRGEWFVSLTLAGEEIDVAGPFDDETDANEMGIRSVFGDGEFIPMPEYSPREYHPNNGARRSWREA